MAWDPKLHPRWPAGHANGMGGKFMPAHMKGTPLWHQQAKAAAAKAAVGPAPAKTAKAAPAKAAPTKAAKAVTPKAGSFTGNVPSTHGNARPAAPTHTVLPNGESADQREKRVLQLMAQNRHLDTDRTQMTGGRWKTARAKQHRAIVNDLMKRHSAVPANGQAIMAGGLIGAGKTTTLQNAAGVKPSDYISINSDVIKEEMAARGMIPQIPNQPDLSPLDHATLVQRESLHIADMWLAEAIRQRKNAIFDASMNAGWPTQSRLQMLKQGGYHVTGVFIDVPVDLAARRSTERYKQDHLAWMNGQGHGGRPIPSSLILGQRSGKSSHNRSTFNSMRSQFDAWQLYDNSGAKPTLVSRG